MGTTASSAISAARSKLYKTEELCDVRLTQNGEQKNPLVVEIYYLASPFAIYERAQPETGNEPSDSFVIRDTSQASVCRQIANKIAAKCGLPENEVTNDTLEQFRQLLKRDKTEPTTDDEKKTFLNDLLKDYDKYPQLLSFKERTFTAQKRTDSVLIVFVRPPGGYLINAKLVKISSVLKDNFLRTTKYEGLRDLAQAARALSKIDAYVINNSDEIQQAYKAENEVQATDRLGYKGVLDTYLKNPVKSAYYAAVNPSNAVKSGISTGAKVLGAAAGLVGVGTLFRIIPRIMKVRNNIKKVWESISDKDEEELTDHLCGAKGMENRAQLKTYLKLAFQGATDSLITLSEEKGDTDDGGSDDEGDETDETELATELATEEEPASDDEEGEFAAAA